jgi:hypothetical protein
MNEMKIKTLLTLIFLGLLVAGTSCKKDDNKALGGSQSAIGQVNNTFTTPPIEGLPDMTIKVTDLTDGVSTVTYSSQITDDNLIPLIQSMTGVNITDHYVERERQYRITSEGMESVYPEGNLILVKYDAEVGDVYTLDRGGKTLRREVVSKSTDDDYYWYGMMIKTINVKETGRGIPGLSNIEFMFNHRFGIVGIIVVFEDGTTRQMNISSNNDN